MDMYSGHVVRVQFAFVCNAGYVLIHPHVRAIEKHCKVCISEKICRPTRLTSLEAESASCCTRQPCMGLTSQLRICQCLELELLP